MKGKQTKSTAGKKTTGSAKKSDSSAKNTTDPQNTLGQFQQQNGGMTSSKSKKNSEVNEQGDLHELFVDLLDDIYYAEQLLVKKLKMTAREATSEELNKAILDHLDVTKVHVERLDKVFESIDEKAEPKKCDAMVGLVKEVESIVDDTEDNSLTRDAGLIISMQKVEHYEIASYGSLLSLAKVLGYDEAASYLEATLDEEKEADSKLSELATASINAEAAME